MGMKEKPIGYCLHELAKLFRTAVKQEVNQMGISTSYFHILNYLSFNHTCKITQSDICSYAKLKAPTISITLQNMENDGLLERVKCEIDSRKTYVKLTDAGHELAKKVKDVFMHIDSVVENSISREKLASFYDCMESMAVELRKKVGE